MALKGDFKKCHFTFSLGAKAKADTATQSGNINSEAVRTTYVLKERMGLIIPKCALIRVSLFSKASFSHRYGHMQSISAEISIAVFAI